MVDGAIQMTLSIIIVNWNSKAYVRGCLTSLYKYSSSTDRELIVVDSGSFDGCGEMLAKELRETHGVFFTGIFCRAVLDAENGFQSRKRSNRLNSLEKRAPLGAP